MRDWLKNTGVKQVKLGTITFGDEDYIVTQMLQHPNGKQVIQLINEQGEESEMIYKPGNMGN